MSSVTWLWDASGNAGIKWSTAASSCLSSIPTALTLSRYFAACCCCTLWDSCITARTTLVVDSYTLSFVRSSCAVGVGFRSWDDLDSDFDDIEENDLKDSDYDGDLEPREKREIDEDNLKRESSWGYDGRQQPGSPLLRLRKLH